MSTFKRKQSFYFPWLSFTELKREAARQERSVSWLMQTAWRLARDQIRTYPSAPMEGRKQPSQ